MRRSTGISAFFSLLKAGSTGAIVLATALSCSDTTSLTAGPDGMIRVRVPSVVISVPDSVKERLSAEVSASASRMVPLGPVANVVLSPGSVASTVSAGSCSSGGGFLGYTKSRVAFNPEAIPNIAPYPLGDEGFIPGDTVRLGFNFNFEGNTYDRVNVYFNGFLLFGRVPSTTKGYSDALRVATTLDPRNIIALAWTDWDPSQTPGGIRYETRGTAPNRRFILQFNNVPEYSSLSKNGVIAPGLGRLMSQVVLSEGSNDITIYTNWMNVTNSKHFVTQAIENASGTDATYDSVLNAATAIWSARNRNFFNLQNDAVRFSLIQTKDEEAPSITAPDNITANNDPGLASAIVTIVPPATSDNCTPVTLSSVRSDGVTSLSAPYPVGVTTITWTAKDDAGNMSSATQTVTVLDKEAPVFGLAAGSLLEFNATSPSGATVTFNTGVTDNVGVTSLSCAPASGSLFPVGPTPVKCTASDAAGNTSDDSFTVSVIGAHEQLFNLLQYVIDLNLPNGTAQPLINQLRVAYSQDAAVACTKMADFLGMVQKKSGNIPSDKKEFMVAEATRIMNAMGCAWTVQASLSARSFTQF